MLQNNLRRYRHLINAALITLFVYGCAGPRMGTTATPDRNARRMLLRDEGLSQLTYVDVAKPANNWYMPVPPGRDLQLTGGQHVLIGTGNGYEERDIATGKKVEELTSFAGTIAARRLRNGNTLLTGLNWQGKKGIVLLEVDKSGNVKMLTNYPAFNYVRLVRETTKGTYVITANKTVFEGRPDGTVIWQSTVLSKVEPHTWQGIRLANGTTMVSTGYGGNMQIFDKDGKLKDSITGTENVHPVFFAGFQMLANGNIAVANWQGHGPKNGASGTQVLEFTPGGELAWSWKQDAAKFSSIQGLLVLDGLDANLLHVEDANGRLVPVKPPNP